MSANRLARHLVIDQFLPPDLHDAVLAHALGNAARFAPSEVRPGARGYIDPDIRRSLVLDIGLGALEGAFQAAIAAQLDELCAGAGIAPFAIARSECELAAHGDGHFFRIHHDTLVEQGRTSTNTDRVLSLVYYFHRQPPGFSAGELAVYPFGGGEPVLIEPRDNRLVAFAAMTPHEVLPVRCPSGQFEDYRFAINCWLHRARQ
jgi:Rps23 Pro-64 3,4-dihydroxylase Tpa1-like proline 4-hydroxylase